MITNFTGVKGDNFKGTGCATLTSGTGVKSVRFKSIEKWSSQNHQILE